MIALLLIALVAINVAYLVLLDRNDIRAGLEREMLLQRIQAPELAVAQHAQPDMSESQGVPLFDDDEQYWRDRDAREMEMAE